MRHSPTSHLFISPRATPLKAGVPPWVYCLALMAWFMAFNSLFDADQVFVEGGGFEKSMAETFFMASSHLLQSQSAKMSFFFGISVGLKPVNA